MLPSRMSTDWEGTGWSGYLAVHGDRRPTFNMSCAKCYQCSHIRWPPSHNQDTASVGENVGELGPC